MRLATHLILFALTSVSAVPANRSQGIGFQTSVTAALNKMIARGTNGVYTGGKGILTRDIFDGMLDSDHSVVPATFQSNDVVVPSQVYPGSEYSASAGNPMCPNNGDSGFNTNEPCLEGPWEDAQVGAVVGSSMDKLFLHFDSIQDSGWGYGVFYASDSNSADQRCYYDQADSGWDCPGGWADFSGRFSPDQSKRGAGYYSAGNPDAGLGGGGAGCHFSLYEPKGIDQTDAIDENGVNLVQDYSCQCNYDLKGADGEWSEYVSHWVKYAAAKPGHEWEKWFSAGLAPSFAMDLAACWVNNPRDMIWIQNQLWWRRAQWNNGLMPAANMQATDAVGQRVYWGWSEVPVDNKLVNSPINWDAVYVKLPAAICGSNGVDDSISCLTKAAQYSLEKTLQQYIDKGLLVPGKENIGRRPGSYVVMLKEQRTADNGAGWERVFYCENWISPSKKYKITYDPVEGHMPGACYLSEW